MRREQLLGELRTAVARHARPEQTTAVHGLLLSCDTECGEPTPARTGTVLALVVQGAKRVALGETALDYEAGQYLLAPLDLPITGHFVRASRAEPALGFGLVLDLERVAELLLQTGPDRPPAFGAGRRTGLALAVADASEALLDAAVRTVRLLEHPEDVAVLRPMLERELLWRVLQGPVGPTLRQVVTEGSSLAMVGRAVRWINEHYAQPVRVGDLADLCGLSPSAFHRQFQAATATSPLQFQKQVRLQQSRLLLLAGATDAAGAGFRVGYESASQFNREYRRCFGLPPGRDVARLRAAAADR